MSEPTICARCAHFGHEMTKYIREVCLVGEPDYVHGGRRPVDPQAKNHGQCPDFLSAPPTPPRKSLLAKIFGGSR